VRLHTLRRTGLSSVSVLKPVGYVMYSQV